jgi:hypothetical protein
MMNPPQSQFAINALSDIFSSKLNLAQSLPRSIFAQRSITSFPEYLSLRVGIAPDCFVGVRVAVASDAHAFHHDNASLIVAEGPFGRVYVRIDEVAVGRCVGVFDDTMDLCEDEMHWSDSMEID